MKEFLFCNEFQSFLFWNEFQNKKYIKLNQIIKKGQLLLFVSKFCPSNIEKDIND